MMLDIHKGYLEPLGRYKNNPLEKGFLDPNDELPGNTVLYFLGTPQDTTGTIYDWSGLENDGTITGATRKILPSGLPYLDFDGSNKVECGNAASLQLTSDFTFKAWVKRGALGGGATHFAIASKYDTGGNERGWSLNFEAIDDKLAFAVSKDGTNLTALDTTDTYTDLTAWLHVVGAYNSIADGSSVMKIYVNDVEKATT